MEDSSLAEGRKFCRGYEQGRECESHSDCNEMLFCKKGALWPYLSTCEPVVDLNELCFDDYDC